MKVKELTTSKLMTIDSDDNLRNAMKIMEKNDISRLFVKRDGKIAGILTERDVSDRLGKLETTPISDAHLHVSSAYNDKLITISEDADIKVAAKDMLDGKISSLAVTDKAGSITGIVTKTDMMRPLEGSTEPLSAHMSRRIVDLKTGSSLLAARKLMLDGGIKRVVVTFDSEVVGMITEKDVAEFLGMFRKVSKGVQWFNKLKTVNVEDVMKTEVLTIKEDSTVGDAVRMMREKDVSGLPVVDRQNKLVGLVTKTDLLKLVAK